MHTLIDSQKQSGYIVDTWVVSRDFLIKNEPVVRDTLECYFRAAYSYQSSGDGQSKLIDLIKADAATHGTTLSPEQAQRLAKGIAWKNTLENFAHFGLHSASVTHIEDMIERVKSVWMQTGGLASDPTGGQNERLFYEKPLRELQEAGFHPGQKGETVRENAQLQQLSDAQWQRVQPVGTADIPRLVYGRGTARLTESSKAKLDVLVETLESFPRYYLMIRGNASSRGDPEANKKLAKQRAEAALQYLIERGVPAAKLKAVDGAITGQTSVTFVLGQLPY